MRRRRAKIDCGVTVCRERVKSPTAFDRRSFRTKRVGSRGTMIVVGCPIGHWHPKRRGRKKCDVGMQSQTILRQMSHQACQVCSVKR